MTFRLHQTPGAHYESAATRMYVGGRTETIRSCSIESIEFAKTMLNAQSSAKEKVQAMKNAINAHKNYTVQVTTRYWFTQQDNFCKTACDLPVKTS